MNLLEKSKLLYNNPKVDESLNQYNQEQYIKAMEYLGDKYILTIKVQKRDVK